MADTLAGVWLRVFGGGTNEGRHATLWDEITTIAQRFITADRYLFAIPMWNNGIPYKLKQYIDLIHQPGLTFGFSPETGYFGLLEGKKATLVYTSGAFSQAFPSPAFGVDHCLGGVLRLVAGEPGVEEMGGLGLDHTARITAPAPRRGSEPSAFGKTAHAARNSEKRRAPA